MTSRLFFTFALSLYLSVAFALPSSPPQYKRNTNSITFPINSSSHTTLQVPKVQCFDFPNPHIVDPDDCSYVLNEIILRDPDVFTLRTFYKNSYRTRAGGHARSRWWRNHCEVEVNGYGAAISTLLSFFEVALTANKILSECVKDVRVPVGGVCPIGDLDHGFVVTVHGFWDLKDEPVGDSLVSYQPALSVSRRATIMSQDNEPENAAGHSPDIATRDPTRSLSRVPNHPVTASTNTNTIHIADPPDYPVHCFNPALLHLPPAVAADCSYVINSIILRLFNPTAPLRFGYTDAADINLSIPLYQKWQHGQCMVSVKNNDASQLDTFRLIDIATTARRVNMRCVIATDRKMGGVSDVGAVEKGFYVYIGAPLGLSGGLDGMMVLNESSGVEGFSTSLRDQ